jgi:hypothetical protein
VALNICTDGFCGGELPHDESVDGYEAAGTPPKRSGFTRRGREPVGCEVLRERMCCMSGVCIGRTPGALRGTSSRRKKKLVCGLISSRAGPRPRRLYERKPGWVLTSAWSGPWHISRRRRLSRRPRSAGRTRTRAACRRRVY